MVTITVDCSRLCAVSIIAFWELMASGLSSLAMSQNWFKPIHRGIFIVSLSLSAIIVRILQITYYKYKLSMIALSHRMSITTESSLNEHIKQEQSTENVQNDDDEVEDKDENEENPLLTEQESMVDDDAKQQEDIASDLMNYKFTLYFIAFSTFNDCTFDIVQGIVLIIGLSTTTLPIAVFGSIIGFSSELIDFFEELFGFALSICKEGADDKWKILENI